MIAQTRALTARFLPQGAILLSVLTFAAYFAGLLRDRVFAQTYGAGAELDAYNAAFQLPELALDVLVAAGLTAPFVPVFTTLRRAGPRHRDPLRADGPDAGGHRHGHHEPRAVPHRPVDRGARRTGVRRGEPGPVRGAVPAHARHAGHLRGVDHPGRDPRRRAAVPVLRAGADPLQPGHRGGHPAAPRRAGHPGSRDRRADRGPAPPRDPRRRRAALGGPNPAPARPADAGAPRVRAG